MGHDAKKMISGFSTERFNLAYSANSVSGVVAHM